MNFLCAVLLWRAPPMQSTRVAFDVSHPSDTQPELLGNVRVHTMALYNNTEWVALISAEATDGSSDAENVFLVMLDHERCDYQDDPQVQPSAVPLQPATCANSDWI